MAALSIRLGSPRSKWSKHAPSDRFYLQFITLLCLVGFSIFLIPLEYTSTAETNIATASSRSTSNGRSILDALAQNLPKDLMEGSIIDDPPYYMVFSTSCHDQMLWESYVFFYHAYKVQQRGSVTRIASGCSPEQAKHLQEFHDKYIRTLRDDFYLHLTPDFSKGVHAGKGRYKYMNKPFGLRHWMESRFAVESFSIVKNITWDAQGPPVSLQSNLEGGIVFLLDPDMVLMRPMVHDFSMDPTVVFAGSSQTPLHKKKVQHGHPIAQQDGYLDNEWMELNVSYITQGKGTLNHVSARDGPMHWNTGPPYLATVQDMYRIAVRWTEYAPRVYDVYPELFAEMYGQIFAATQLNLSHTLIQSLVVSQPASGDREGWPMIDAIAPADTCAPTQSLLDGGNYPLPFILHYCQRYLLDTWFFSKYRLKKQYISCSSPLLQLPPSNLATLGFTYAKVPPPNRYKDLPLNEYIPPILNFSETTPRTTSTSDVQPKRQAFMVCAMISAVNEAASYFKQMACSKEDPSTNWNTNYTFFNDPNDH